MNPFRCPLYSFHATFMVSRHKPFWHATREREWSAVYSRFMLLRRSRLQFSLTLLDNLCDAPLRRQGCTIMVRNRDCCLRSAKSRQVNNLTRDKVLFIIAHQPLSSLFAGDFYGRTRGRNLTIGNSKETPAVHAFARSVLPVVDNINCISY